VGVAGVAGGAGAGDLSGGFAALQFCVGFANVGFVHDPGQIDVVGGLEEHRCCANQQRHE
jgi:hypothetical protein